MRKKKLEDIADIVQGIPVSRIRTEEAMELEERTVYSFESESKVLIAKNDEKMGQKIPLVERDIILFNIVSYSAKKATEEDLGKIVPSNYVIVRLRDRNISPDYLAWYMDQAEGFKRELNKLRQGSAVLSIPINEFRKIDLRLPSLEVQDRVGKINKLKERRKNLFLEREELIEKAMVTINEEEL